MTIHHLVPVLHMETLPLTTACLHCATNQQVFRLTDMLTNMTYYQGCGGCFHKLLVEQQQTDQSPLNRSKLVSTLQAARQGLTQRLSIQQVEDLVAQINLTISELMDTF